MGFDIYQQLARILHTGFADLQYRQETGMLWQSHGALADCWAISPEVTPHPKSAAFTHHI